MVDLAPNWWGPRYSFLEGLILMNEAQLDYQRIKNCFESSIKADEDMGAIVPAAQTKYYLAKFMTHQGDEKDSISIFRNLHESFQEWRIFEWEKKCEQELEPYRF